MESTTSQIIIFNIPRTPDGINDTSVNHHFIKPKTPKGINDSARLYLACRQLVSLASPSMPKGINRRVRHCHQLVTNSWESFMMSVCETDMASACHIKSVPLILGSPSWSRDENDDTSLSHHVSSINSGELLTVSVWKSWHQPVTVSQFRQFWEVLHGVSEWGWHGSCLSIPLVLELLAVGAVVHLVLVLLHLNGGLADVVRVLDHARGCLDHLHWLHCPLWIKDNTKPALAQPPSLNQRQHKTWVGSTALSESKTTQNLCWLHHPLWIKDNTKPALAPPPSLNQRPHKTCIGSTTLSESKATQNLHWLHHPLWIKDNTKPTLAPTPSLNQRQHKTCVGSTTLSESKTTQNIH